MDYKAEYEAMVQRVRELHESGNELTRKQMEIVCSELKESEDEKIRKYLIDCVNSTVPEALAFKKISKEQILAWLEKQKEPLTPENKMNHPLYLEGFDVGKQVGEVLKEQKPTEWSEEDEKIHRNLMSELGNLRVMGKIKESTSKKYISWLKSLRPQSKQEIEKENEAIIGRLKTEISLAKAFNRKHQEEVFGLIDSLRPQSQWKPSEEQMDALRNVAYGGLYYGDTPKLLKLYNELKALAK